MHLPDMFIGNGCGHPAGINMPPLLLPGRWKTRLLAGRDMTAAAGHRPFRKGTGKGTPLEKSKHQGRTHASSSTAKANTRT
jgi:hypothetical protein